MNQLQIAMLGFVIILIGIAVMFSSMFFAPKPKEKAEVKFSVFGLLGFIPFGISNDKKLFVISIVLTALLIVFTAIMFYRAFGR